MTCGARVSLAVFALAALLTSGCSQANRDDPDPSSSASQTPAPSTTTESADLTEGEDHIDIGGAEVYLRCWGEAVSGEPTVLLVAGSNLTTSTWEVMAEDFATDGHHVCAYDRLGVGRSDAPQDARRTTNDQVDDLVALLDGADLQEPVVVAAHSLGSLPTLGLVHRAPERVAGVVLVDPWSPRVSGAQRAALPPKKPDESPELAEERRFIHSYLKDPTQNPEHLLLAENDADAVKLLDEPGPLFGDLPVVVLQAPPLPPLPGLPRRYHEATVAAIDEGSREFAAESQDGTVIKVEDTGHNIHEDQPAAVMDAIRDVLAG